MAGHLGPLGAFSVELPLRSLSVNTGERYAVQEASGKRWAFAKTAGPLPRQWSLESVPLTSSQAGAIQEVLDGGHGVEPLVFVPCPGHRVNVLTPAQSLMVGVANAGPWRTASGEVATVSHIGAGASPVVLADRVPVVPGKSLFFALDVLGDKASVELVFLGPAGNQVAKVGAKALGDLPQRVTHRVLQVPSNAVAARLQVSGHQRCARPQVAWGSGSPAWGAGQTGAQVVVQSGSVAPVRGGWWQGSLEILEVG